MKDMLGRGHAVTVDEAKSALLGALPEHLPAIEAVAIQDALGRVLAQDVISPVSLPAFARSTMDGYAVRAADTYGSTEAMPAYLKVAGEVLMGEEPVHTTGKGEAFSISTGGMLPQGADAVVMLEHTSRLDGDELEVMRPAAPGENVVQPGEDVAAGDVLLMKGHRLRPQDAGALAGVGIVTVEVFKRPVVAVINTGNEIVDAGAEPRPGQVRDINSYNLAGLILNAGGTPVMLGIYPDDYDAIKSAVGKGLSDADAVAITGGSSVGARDLTAGVIDELGKKDGRGVLVHGVSVKPGKPVIIGMAGGKAVFGLPGHPVAVTVSFGLFVAPLIKRLSGEVDPLGLAGIPPVRVVRARMARNYSSSAGREDHLRVALEKRGDELWAVPILGKSGLITTLVRAHGTVVIPLARLGLPKGEWVDVELFD
jgi:molybdopterin molybdotransferase